MKQSILVVLVSLLLSGCSTYKSSFGCGDAKGAECYAMDRVDRMIASGEIERFNEANQKCQGKSKGRSCKQSRYKGSDNDDVFIPDVDRVIPASIYSSALDDNGEGI